MLACAVCGEPNPERARFCLECGAPIGREAAPPPETRKVVTVVFSDLAGSTSLGERLDPESLSRLMARWFERARAVLERHGGTVQKFIGDAVMAVFGIPTVHEEDALRAVRAAADLYTALTGLNQELAGEWGETLRLRTGVNTGEVLAGDPAVGEALVVGDAVNLAARLEQAAQPDEILLGETTWLLVRDAVEVTPLPPLALKGKNARVAAYRLDSVSPVAPGRVRRLDRPMVGRQQERVLLRLLADSATQRRACHLVTVLGTAAPGQEGSASASLQLTDVLGVSLGTGLGGVFVALGDGRGWDTSSSLTLAFIVTLAVAAAGVLASRRLPRQLPTAAGA